MISRTTRLLSPRERRRFKTAHHPRRNVSIRQLHSRGWSIRQLARRFMLSPSRIWEVCHGQGPPYRRKRRRA